MTKAGSLAERLAERAIADIRRKYRPQLGGRRELKVREASLRVLLDVWVGYLALRRAIREDQAAAAQEDGLSVTLGELRRMLLSRDC